MTNRAEGIQGFFFCIPLKPKSRCSDWGQTSMLVSQTLRSILNQTDPDFQVFVAGHDRPDLPELNDSRVSFHPVSFPEPNDGREGKRDQTRKTHFLGAIVKEHGGGYMMVVDHDDLVHKDIVRFVRSDDNRTGYMIRAGYILDVEKGRLGKFSGNPPRQFFNHCGTSSILYLSPDDLPDRTPDKTNLVRGNSFMESVWGHGSWEAKLLERDIYPGTLPFRGSVYRLNTGDNASYTYRRDIDTIERLISCAIDHPAPISILETDFGLGSSEIAAFDAEQRDAGPSVAQNGDLPAVGKAGELDQRKQERSGSDAAIGRDENGRQQSERRYAGKFYSQRRARTLHSAQQILGIVMERFPVRSVIDIGCGTGTWLDVARSLGAATIKGLEGLWLDLEQRDADYIRIERADLEQPIRQSDRYDLAICLEVAEHLSEGRAESLVADLCSLSDIVLFGAAIPGQGGRGHVNEQWQTYWAELFSKNDYVPLDLVRPKIWGDRKIRFWYKQNTLLYCRRQVIREVSSDAGLPALDVVHPGLMERKLKKHRQTIKALRTGLPK